MGNPNSWGVWLMRGGAAALAGQAGGKQLTDEADQKAQAADALAEQRKATAAMRTGQELDNTAKAAALNDLSAEAPPSQQEATGPATMNPPADSCRRAETCRAAAARRTAHLPHPCRRRERDRSRKERSSP